MEKKKKKLAASFVNFEIRENQSFSTSHICRQTGAPVCLTICTYMQFFILMSRDYYLKFIWFWLGRK